MTAAPSSQAGLASIVGGIGSAPRVGAERVQVRIEWGVRFDGNRVAPCVDESMARISLKGLRGMTDNPEAYTLVSRRVEVHPWRAEIVAPESGGSDA